jgi:hypothetical protein
MSVRIVDAARIRALVGFEDLIEPVSRAFQDFSAGLAQCAIVTMFPTFHPALGDVYVKTGCIRGHSHYLVKVSPWFAGEPRSGTGAGWLSRCVRFNNRAHSRHLE